MRRIFESAIVTTGLAIFSMLFGAGNLIFPINVGRMAGSNVIFASLIFISTAVLIPLLGLVSIILFDGNYNKFFGRLGKIPGQLIVLFCMIVLGPLIVMPRITTLSYEMITPFFPTLSLGFFSFIFLGITFILSYKENKIVDVLGNYISPLLLLSLGIIIVKGIVHPQIPAPGEAVDLHFVWQYLQEGYNTLDLLGTIFFSAMVIGILKATHANYNNKKLATVALKSGILAVTLLGLVYIGMGLLGAFYGQDLGAVNAAQVFSIISFRILGPGGALIISTAVLMACFSTIIALAAVIAEYIQHSLYEDQVSYVQALLATLGLTGIMSHLGLDAILSFSLPIIYIGYPVIIATAVCNLAYKLFGFKHIKMPVLAVFIAALLNHFM